jgi:ribosomal protein L36
LYHLEIYVAWTPESYLTFARSLRTNESLNKLDFFPFEAKATEFNPILFGPLEAVLESHNCTLEQVGARPQKPSSRDVADLRLSNRCRHLNSLVKRNGSVRLVNKNLSFRTYRIHKNLWALALGRVSSHPYLIQRILRRGNVAEFAAHVSSPAGAGQLLLSSSDPALPVFQRGGTGETAVPAGASELLKLSWTRRVLTSHSDFV